MEPFVLAPAVSGLPWPENRPEDDSGHVGWCAPQQPRSSTFAPRSLEELTSGLCLNQMQNFDPHEAAQQITMADPKAMTPEPLAMNRRMVHLAKKITSEAEELEAYMELRGLQPPDPGAASGPDGGMGCGDFPKLPKDLQERRQSLLQATKELEDLVRGPRERLRWSVWAFLDTMSLQLVNSYGLANLFPVGSTTTMAELESKTTLDPVNLARVIHHAMTNGIFCEPSPGIIAHTAASRLLAEDAELRDWIGFNCEDIFPAAACTLTALRADPLATSLVRTGFNYAFDTVDKEPMFKTFAQDPLRAKRMGGAMSSLTGGEGYEISHLVDAYNFADIDEKGGTFVDVGGSYGFVSVALARRWKKMKFIVQDTPPTVENAPRPVCEDTQVAERVQLMAADFFKEQPVYGADVYFFRWIFHNYSTPYAVKILKNLIPALKPGARVLINDHCLREFGQEKPWDEKVMRGMDMIMLSLLNAQERSEKEFRDLFAAASEHFYFMGVHRPEGCRMSIIEAVWLP